MVTTPAIKMPTALLPGQSNPLVLTVLPKGVMEVAHESAGAITISTPPTPAMAAPARSWFDRGVRDGLAVGAGTESPALTALSQKRQTTASSWISSAHQGHFFKRLPALPGTCA